MGIAEIVGSDTELQVRESTEANLKEIQVSLKSRPYTDGNVLVEVATSCKDGKELQSRKSTQTDDLVYFCNDDPNDPTKETEPLAKFDLDRDSLYAKNTLQFTKADWDVPQKLKVQGIDNTFKADGYEKFTISVRIVSADGEDCSAKGCGEKQPYTNYKK